MNKGRILVVARFLEHKGYKAMAGMFFRSVSLISVCISVVSFIEGMQLVQPYYAFVKPRYNPESTSQFFVLAEHGFSPRAFASHGCTDNPLALWQPQQDALAMLKGFSANSEQGNLLVQLQDDPSNCTQVCVTGDLQEKYALGCSLRYNLPLNFYLTAYLPVYHLALHNVAWKTVGQDGCELTKELLTDNFIENVKRLGNGLNLGSWQRTGVGDFVLMTEWTRDFAQRKEFLKNVRLNCRFAGNFPSGKLSDEDLVYAFPFGLNGSLGLIYGGSMEILFGRYMRLSVDVELTQLFGTTRTRRIKTATEQTDVLLLQKACAYYDPGMIQHFNIALGFYDLFDAFFCSLDYSFYKRGKGELAVIPQQFSTEIANQAVSLDDWTAHNLIAKLGYEPKTSLSSSFYIKPNIALYARVPFNGTRSILFPALGILASVDF